MFLHRTPSVWALVFIQFCLSASVAHTQETQEPNIEPVSNNFILGKISAQKIVEHNLALIEKWDHQYNAVIISDEMAVLNAAQSLDQIESHKKSELSIPAMTVLLKDNIESREYPTTAGSLALANNHTQQDAPLVANLRKQGAIILGKTNLSEWANFRSEHSISGWSAVGGQTKNAIDATRSPCGSSSGSAVAVALGYSQAAIGTETDGSIVCPAAVNGVVGFKPTHGLIDGNGIVPLASSQDTAGPIARTVHDVALLLSAMIEPDSDTNKKLQRALSTSIEISNLKGMRIGLLSNTRGYEQRRDELLASGISIIENLGAEVIDDLGFSPYEEFGQDSYDVLLYEFKKDLNSYFANLPGDSKNLTLEKLIQFNKDNTAQELKYFDQSIFIKAQELKLSEESYLEKRSKIKSATRAQGIDHLMEKHNLDALIGITLGPAWKIDEINGDAFFGPGVSSYPAIAGNPHITVPLGKISGLPIGLSFIGKRYADDELAQIAYQFEQAKNNIDPL